MDELLSKHSLHTEYHIAVSIVMLFCLFIKRQVGNAGPGLGQARTCGWVKPVLLDKSVKLEIYDLLLLPSWYLSWWGICSRGIIWPVVNGAALTCLLNVNVYI